MITLESVPNIGKRLAKKLQSIQINTFEDLQRIGAIEAFKFLQSMNSDKLPLCYYLYSFEAAIQGKKWTALSLETKRKLKKSVGR